jgi:hypothetical protein
MSARATFGLAAIRWVISLVSTPHLDAAYI